MTDYSTPDGVWAGIIPCVQHRHYMDGCDACEAEMTARGAKIDQMQAEAGQVLKDIAMQGGPQMPQTVIMEARLDVLIDSILSDPKDRMRYEGEVGRRVMLSVKAMQAQVKQPTLHVPPHLKKV